MKTILFVCLFCLMMMPASAATITLASGDGVGEWNNVGPNVLIPAHPAWMTLSSGKWVSFTNSGYNQTVVPNTTVASGIPTATFFESLPTGMYILSLNVLADDTAGVYIKNLTTNTRQQLKAPNPNQDGACAAGPIGCTPGENWTSTFSLNPSQTYRLEIELFQIGGGPTGTDYEGSGSTVPEPSTLAACAAGLVGLGLLRKNRRN